MKSRDHYYESPTAPSNLHYFHVLFLQSELAAQKEALDTEHCKALEALKNQVHAQSS